MLKLMGALLVTTFIGWILIWAYAEHVYRNIISELKAHGRIAYLANVELRVKNTELRDRIKLLSAEVSGLRHDSER